MKILILGGRSKPTLKIINDYFINVCKKEVLWLDLPDIVNDILINDSITEHGKVSIRWKIGGEVITPEIVQLVLNDLQYLPESLFSDFVSEDQEYVRSEYAAYLMFSLSHFNNVLNLPYGGSISGFCRSLPYQWLFVKSLSKKVCVPKFHFGPPNTTPATIASDYNVVISRNIYDGRNWLTNKVVDFKNDPPSLFYLRPAGRPIAIQFLDNKIWSIDIASSKPFVIENDELINIISDLAIHFNLRAMEALVFYNQDRKEFTFGSCQPFIELELLSLKQRNEILDILSQYANQK